MKTFGRLFRFLALPALLAALLAFPRCEGSSTIEIIDNDFAFTLSFPSIDASQAPVLQAYLIKGPEGAYTLSAKLDGDSRVPITCNGSTGAGSVSFTPDMEGYAEFSFEPLPAGRHALSLLFRSPKGLEKSENISFDVREHLVRAQSIEAPVTLLLRPGASLDTTVRILPDDTTDTLEVSVTRPEVATATVTGEGSERVLHVEGRDQGTSVVMLRCGSVATAVEVEVRKDLAISISPREAEIAPRRSQMFNVNTTTLAYSAWLSDASLGTVSKMLAAISVVSSNATFRSHEAWLVVACDENPAVCDSAKIVFSPREETVTLSDPTVKDNTATLVVGGENEGWELVPVSGVEASVSGSVITLTNGTYASATVSVVVRTVLQGVEARRELVVPGRAIEVTSVAIDPDELTIEEDRTRLLHLTAAMSDGSAVDRTADARWSCSSNLSLDGSLVKALAAGPGWVKATLGSFSAMVPVTVTAKPVTLASLSLSPASFYMEEESSLGFALSATYSDGSSKDVTAEASWRCSANLSMSGASFTATKAGDAWVEASFGGLTARAAGLVYEKTVIEASLVAISSDVASLRMTEGDGRQVVITAAYSDATTKDVTAVCTFSPEDATVASVGAGYILARKAGFTTVTATYSEGGVTRSCAILVTVDALVVKVTGVTLDSKELSLKEGESYQLAATVTPPDATDDRVLWSSSKPAVASVDNNGNVTANSAGTAVITAKTVDEGFTASCVVTVKASSVDVQRIDVEPSEVDIKTGETAQLSVQFTPSDASDKSISWSSDRTSVATVDKNGLVKGVKEGSARITARSSNGKTSYCDVTVTKVTVPVTGVTLDKTDLSLVAGTYKQLNATIIPSNATNQNLIWSTGNENVASVSTTGMVSGIKAGSTQVTVMTVDNLHTASCQVTVTKATVPVSGVSLSERTLTITRGKSAPLIATVFPLNATNKNITWSVDDDSVVAVVSTGNSSANVTGLKVGSATVTVKTEDGDIVESCQVIVNESHAERVTLNQTYISLITGKISTLEATVEPDNAVDKSVEWKSSDENVATVSGTGNKVTVTAVGKGKAKITVTAKDQTNKDQTNGTLTATCSVSVSDEPVTGVRLNSETASIANGKTFTLTATVEPSYATNKNVTWSSSNAAVASVSQNGIVEAHSNGSATITVSSDEDQRIKASCAVTVFTPLSDVIISMPKSSQVSLNVGESDTFSATLTPSGASATLAWSSDKPAIASVDNNGKVTANSAGTATITCTASGRDADGATVQCTATKTVMVKEIPVTGVVFTCPDEPEFEMTVGDQNAFAAHVVPDSATVKGIIWGVQIEDILTIDQFGLYKALSVGQTEVYAIAESNHDIFATIFVTVKPSSVDPTSIELKPTSMNLTVGQSSPIEATVYPRGASQAVKWSSSAPTVASVDNNGNVTAKSAGKTTITATSAIDEEVKSSCIVEVTNPVISIQNVSFSSEEITIEEGERNITIEAQIEPYNVSVAKIDWTSDDEKVVMVSGNGEIDAYGKTKATLTAKTAGRTWVNIEVTDNAGNRKSSTIKVIVEKKETPVTPVIKIPESLSLKVNETKTLSVLAGTTVSSDDIRWYSDNDDIATVGFKNGKVTGIAVDETYIYACYKDDEDIQSDPCRVTVSFADPTSVSISPNSLNLTEDEDYLLTATVFPKGADQSVIWSSSAPTVASVDNNGNVTANSAGQATITATANSNKNIESSILVKVEKKETPVTLVTSITLNHSSELLSIDQTLELTAEVTPNNATNKDLAWSTSDENVATVTVTASSVTVTAKSAGTATITAKATDDSGESASCDIEVYRPISSVTINGTAQMTVGEGAQFSASADRSDVAVTGTVWKSGDESVATVTSDGYVTAVRQGTATIECTMTDKGGANRTGKLTVTVSEAVIEPEYVVLDPTSMNLTEGQSSSIGATVYPEGADQSVTWSSDKPAIASVDNNGNVTANSAGTAVITATTVNGKTASCNVTVTSAAVKLESVTIHGFRTSDGYFTNQIDEGKTRNLVVSVQPADASVVSYVWGSRNEAVAQVGSDGEVRGINAGRAVITCDVTDSYGTTRSTSYEVEVVPSGTQVTGLAFRRHDYYLDADETVIEYDRTYLGLGAANIIRMVNPESPASVPQTCYLELEVSPSAALFNPSDIVWTIEDTSIARMDGDDKIVGLKEGNTYVTARLGNYEARQEIRIRTQMVPHRLSISDVNIYEGETKSIMPVIDWAGTNDRNLYRINYNVQNYFPSNPFIILENNNRIADSADYTFAATTASIEAFGEMEGQKTVKCSLSKTGEYSDNPFFWFYYENLYQRFRININAAPIIDNNKLTAHLSQDATNSFWVSLDDGTSSIEVTDKCTITTSSTDITYKLLSGETAERPWWIWIYCAREGNNVGTVTVTYGDYNIELIVSKHQNTVYVNWEEN